MQFAVQAVLHVRLGKQNPFNFLVTSCFCVEASNNVIHEHV